MSLITEKIAIDDNNDKELKRSNKIELPYIYIINEIEKYEPIFKIPTKYIHEDPIERSFLQYFLGCIYFFGNYISFDINKAIGEKCFVKCSKLAHISLPPNVTEIRDYTFTGCSMLTKIIIPPSVNSIGIHAFAGCSALKKIKIPPSLVYIGPHAFSGCLEMQKISITSSVEVIGQDIFDGCQSLKFIAIPRSLSLENNIFPDSCKIVKK